MPTPARLRIVRLLVLAVAFARVAAAQAPQAESSAALAPRIAANSIVKLPRVDVRHPDFGSASHCPNAADPSGSQDSTCAIQAAVAWSHDHPQGSTYADVYLAAGTYKISSAIYLPCQLHVVGDGPQATVIEPTNNSQNAFTIRSDPHPPQPDLWTCNGSLENLTIHAPGGHLYTATMVELQPNAVGYTVFRIRGSGGGGRGLAAIGERFKAIDTEWDAVRWPVIAYANEMKFLDTQIASAGQADDDYCFAPANCVNGIFPSWNWKKPQLLAAASASGKTATFVITGGDDANSSNGKSPLVAGHWFNITGIRDVTALNGTWQVARVRNNSPSANQYTVTANIATSGTASVAGATFKPAILPERVSAFYLFGSAISVLGGSIKANWYTGCFQTNAVFSGIIEGFYCEGYPVNGQPHVNADITMNSTFQTTLTAPLSGNACSNAAPCSAPVASTLWAPYYINNPADIAITGAQLNMYLYPPDYSAGSTSCSPYVKTSSGGCVQRGQREAVLAAFSGDGQTHITRRNQSGTTTSGNVTWPAGSVLLEMPSPNYGTFTVKSSHLESIDPPGPNWAVACDDTNERICATAVIGSIPNGYTTIGARNGGTAAVTFENDEWWGLGGPDAELVGQGFIKVPGVARITSINGGFSSPAGETSEITSGRYIANRAPTVVAVQYPDGSSGIVSYANLNQGTFATNTTGPFYESMVNHGGDPVLGANPNSRFPMGRQFASSTCSYDVPPPGQPHALYRFCMKGGPTNTGSNAGWEYDIWNGKQWANAFAIADSGNGAASVNITGNTRTASLQLGSSKTPITAASGNGTIIATVSGPLINGHVLVADANGNIRDGGAGPAHASLNTGDVFPSGFGGGASNGPQEDSNALAPRTLPAIVCSFSRDGYTASIPATTLCAIPRTGTYEITLNEHTSHPGSGEVLNAAVSVAPMPGSGTQSCAIATPLNVASWTPQQFTGPCTLTIAAGQILSFSTEAQNFSGDAAYGLAIIVKQVQ